MIELIYRVIVRWIVRNCSIARQQEIQTSLLHTHWYSLIIYVWQWQHLVSSLHHLTPGWHSISVELCKQAERWWHRKSRHTIKHLLYKAEDLKECNNHLMVACGLVKAQLYAVQRKSNLNALCSCESNLRTWRCWKCVSDENQHPERIAYWAEPRERIWICLSLDRAPMKPTCLLLLRTFPLITRTHTPRHIPHCVPHKLMYV